MRGDGRQERERLVGALAREDTAGPRDVAGGEAELVRRGVCADERARERGLGRGERQRPLGDGRARARRHGHALAPRRSDTIHLGEELVERGKLGVAFDQHRHVAHARQHVGEQVEHGRRHRVGVVVEVVAVVEHSAGDMDHPDALVREGARLVHGIEPRIDRVGIEIRDVEEERAPRSLDDLRVEVSFAGLSLTVRKCGRDVLEQERNVPELPTRDGGVARDDVDGLSRPRERREVPELQPRRAHEADVLGHERRAQPARELPQPTSTIAVDSLGGAQGQLHAVRNDGHDLGQRLRLAGRRRAHVAGLRDHLEEVDRRRIAHHVARYLGAKTEADPAQYALHARPPQLSHRERR